MPQPFYGWGIKTLCKVAAVTKIASILLSGSLRKKYFRLQAQRAGNRQILEAR